MEKGESQHYLVNFHRRLKRKHDRALAFILCASQRVAEAQQCATTDQKRLLWQDQEGWCATAPIDSVNIKEIEIYLGTDIN